MTFTEAAVEVLRLAKRPLHYKKITEFAIAHHLLSHVGKTPEITMSSRLAVMVKNDRGDAPIVKVRPGIFGLREFGEEVLNMASSDNELDSIPAPENASASLRQDTQELGMATLESDVPISQEDFVALEDGPKSIAANLDLSEEDELLLGNSDESESESRGGVRRRRRRRRRSGSRSTELPSTSNFDADDDVPVEHARPDYDMGSVDSPIPDQVLVGQSLSEAAFSVMLDGPRKPLSITQIAEMLVRRGRLSGDPVTLVPTVAAALRADGARRAQSNERPRFRAVPSGRIVLTNWSVPKEALRFERDALQASKRQQEYVYRALCRKLEELSAAGFAELIATWLNTHGFGSLRAVRPPISAEGSLCLAGVLRQGLSETRVGIVVFRNGKELRAERLVEARGAIHHFSEASLLWIITTGHVSREALEEASVPGAIPCVLFDGMALAASLQTAGIGIRSFSVPMSMLDFDLLESLRGSLSNSPTMSARPERERDRDRADRDRDRGDRDRDRDRNSRDRGRSWGARRQPNERRNVPAQASNFDVEVGDEFGASDIPRESDKVTQILSTGGDEPFAHWEQDQGDITEASAVVQTQLDDFDSNHEEDQDLAPQPSLDDDE